jgi:hypothetical protein
MLTISKELKTFIDDLCDGIYDETKGAWIARHFGKELREIARDLDTIGYLEDDDGEPKDLIDLFNLS